MKTRTSITKTNQQYRFSMLLTVSPAAIKPLILFYMLVCIAFSAEAEEPKDYAMINITAGQVGVFDNLNSPQRYGLEYRFKSFPGLRGFRLIPAIGFAISHNGAKFIYSDLRHDFYLNGRWVLTPSFGAGSFDDSREINLGNRLEFRSGIEISRIFSNKMQAGIALFHLSNGGISQKNPGTEALVFSLCFPIHGTDRK